MAIPGIAQKCHYDAGDDPGYQVIAGNRGTHTEQKPEHQIHPTQTQEISNPVFARQSLNGPFAVRAGG